MATCKRCGFESPQRAFARAEGGIRKCPRCGSDNLGGLKGLFRRDRDRKAKRQK